MGEHAVALLALGYKQANRGFDFGFRHWKFSLTKTFRQHFGPGFEYASNRNKCQEYFLGLW